MVLGIRFGTIQSAGGAAFVPTDIAGLEIWLDADDAGTITEAAGKVSQWDDKTVNGNDATQGTGSKQPTTGTRTQNSKNVLDFDGSSDMMQTASFAAALTQPFTVFIVSKLDTANDTMIDGLANRVAIFANSFPTDWSAIASTTFNSGTSHDTTPHAHGVVFDSASSEYFLDGTSLATGDAGGNSLDGVTVGAFFTDSANWDGWIAEILVYDTELSGANITTVNDYLIAKWGV